MNFDSIDDTIATEPSLRKGIPGLWLAVFLLSIRELQSSHNAETARHFIFDPENFAMDLIADELDLSPEGLRRMIRASIPGAWPGEHRKT